MTSLYFNRAAMRRLSVLVVLLSAAAAPSAAAECTPSAFNFFPPGKVNEPGGWTRLNQTLAGNECEGHLLPIAAYGAPKPLLHFLPKHPLFNADEKVASSYVRLDTLDQAAVLLRERRAQRAAAAAAAAKAAAQKAEQAAAALRAEAMTVAAMASDAGGSAVLEAARLADAADREAVQLAAVAAAAALTAEEAAQQAAPKPPPASNAQQVAAVAGVAAAASAPPSTPTADELPSTSTFVAPAFAADAAHVGAAGAAAAAQPATAAEMLPAAAAASEVAEPLSTASGLRQAAPAAADASLAAAQTPLDVSEGRALPLMTGLGAAAREDVPVEQSVAAESIHFGEPKQQAAALSDEAEPAPPVAAAQPDSASAQTLAPEQAQAPADTAAPLVPQAEAEQPAAPAAPAAAQPDEAAQPAPETEDAASKQQAAPATPATAAPAAPAAPAAAQPDEAAQPAPETEDAASKQQAASATPATAAPAAPAAAQPDEAAQPAPETEDAASKQQAAPATPATAAPAAPAPAQPDEAAQPARETEGAASKQQTADPEPHQQAAAAPVEAQPDAAGFDAAPPLATPEAAQPVAPLAAALEAAPEATDPVAAPDAASPAATLQTPTPAVAPTATGTDAAVPPEAAASAEATPLAEESYVPQPQLQARQPQPQPLQPEEVQPYPQSKPQPQQEQQEQQQQQQQQQQPDAVEQQEVEAVFQAEVEQALRKLLTRTKKASPMVKSAVATSKVAPANKAGMAPANVSAAATVAAAIPVAAAATAAAAAAPLAPAAAPEDAAALSNWTVAEPALYNFSVAVNDRLWFRSSTFNSSEVPVVNFDANYTEGRRDIFDPEVFREGINTLIITVTLLKDSAVLTNGTHNLTAPAADESLHSPAIDFYFFMNGNATHDSRPSAEVTFHSCSPELSIELRNTTPPPVMLDGYRLTYTPTPTSQAFFLPVYYVYGTYAQGLDGTTDLQSDNTIGNVKNFGVYVTRLPGSPSSFNATAPMLDAIKEGWYTTTVEGAIWSPNSQMDHLLSVSGIDRFGNSDAAYVTVRADGSITDSMSLYGGFKGAGWVLPRYNNSRMGFQRAPTYLNFFEGPTTPLTLGERAVFNWDFTGLGNATCVMNGVNVNLQTGSCSSPLVYPIVTTLNQTLEVQFRDVCDATHKASLTFGTFGWEVEPRPTPPGRLENSGKIPIKDDLSARRNGAGGGRRRTWRHVALSALAVLMFTLALLP